MPCKFAHQAVNKQRDYIQYLRPFQRPFTRWTWVSWSPLVPQENLWEEVARIFYHLDVLSVTQTDFLPCRCPTCHSTNILKALKRTQGTDVSQWPSLILLSSHQTPDGRLIGPFMVALQCQYPSSNVRTGSGMVWKGREKRGRGSRLALLFSSLQALINVIMLYFNNSFATHSNTLTHISLSVCILTGVLFLAGWRQVAALRLRCWRCKNSFTRKKCVWRTCS